MKRILIIAAVLILVIFIALILMQRFQGVGSIWPFERTKSVILGSQTVKVEVADTPEEKEIGLSGKKSLAENNGMLFTFEEPGYFPFWMKNMQFPIDIIYARDNKIVTILSNVQPLTSENDSPIIYYPDEPADTVIEVTAGFAQKNNLKKGDQITIK